ncbi:MAG: hypothetical protein ACYS8Z_23685, partial [Planctomycetota bacterium]
MRSSLIMAVCLLTAFATRGYARKYTSKHFVVESNLDSRYVQFVVANAEAYYGHMTDEYYPSGGNRRVVIYFSETAADTHKLFRRDGISGRPRYGLYRSDPPSIYTHRYLDAGGLTGWGTLFHEITHHLVAVNYPNAPPWFDEGLATILGEQARIAGGKVDLGKPNPWREHALREMIKKGFKIDVRTFLSLSRKDFANSTAIYHPVRA